MWPLKTVLYFGFFWITCFLALFNPIWGVLNYMLAYQTNPTVTWWGEPLLATGMRFSLLAAVFTMTGMFFGRRRVPHYKPFFSWWEIGLIVLVMIGFLNAIIGVSYDHRTKSALEKLWKMMVFVLILARLGSNRANLKMILWSLMLGGLYVGFDAYTAGPKDFMEGRLNRIGGPDFATSSGTAAYLTAILPIVGTVFLISKSLKARVLALIAGAFVANGIILCRTRSAFIGFAAGALAAFMMAPRVKRYRIHASLIAAAILMFTLTDYHYWDRMATLTDSKALSEDRAATSRADIWKVSLQILLDNPQGIGTGNFARIIGRYDHRYKKRSTHNTLVVSYVEFGIFGGLTFTVMILMSLWYIRRSSAMADRSDQPLETRLIAYGLLISSVTYIITGLGTERFYCESFWWILVLPLCLYRTIKLEAAAKDRLLEENEVLDLSHESKPCDDWIVDALPPADDRPRPSFA